MCEADRARSSRTLMRFLLPIIICSKAYVRPSEGVNLATGVSTSIYLQSALVVKNNSNLTNGSQTGTIGTLPDDIPSSFYGYSIDWSLKGINVGSPKLVDRESESSQKQLLEANQAKGSIESCTNLTTTTAARECKPITPPSAQLGDSFGQSLSNFRNEELVACAPTREQNCSSGHYNPGYCYRSLNQGQTWSPETKTNSIDCAGKLDMMFVLDGSATISFKNFDIVKNWTMEIAKRFDLVSGSAKIGVVQYSYYNKSWPEEYNQIRTEVELGKCNSQTCFQNKVNKIRQFRSQTYTAHALIKTINDFKASNRFNDSATSKILILLTDGKSTDWRYLKQSANYVRSFGITTFAIGVGRSFDLNELKTIATGTDKTTRVYQVTDFDRLPEIVNQLKSSIFSVSLEGSRNQDGASLDLNFGETGFSNKFSYKVGELYTWVPACNDC